MTKPPAPDDAREALQFLGTPPQRGTTLGPAFRGEGLHSFDALLRQGLPCVLVARYLDKRALDVIELSRVLGFVVEHGSPIDPVWDLLAAVQKPSIMGATGIWDAVRSGEQVIVDAVGAQALLRAPPPVVRRFQNLKGTHPPREPAAVREVLGQLIGPIRQAWQHAGRTLPFDCAEQRQLYAVGWKIAQRIPPDAADDALVERRLFRDARPKESVRYEPPGP